MEAERPARSLGVGSPPRARDGHVLVDQALKSGKSQGHYRILPVQSGQNAYDGVGLVATAPLLLGARNAPATTGARTAPALVRRPDVAGAPPPEQVHLQFGADAATEMAVSWAAPSAVARPRLRVGRAGGGFGRDVPAEERVYTEALTGETVWTYHARLRHLEPDTAFVYEVLHNGAEPVPTGMQALFHDLGINVSAAAA